MVPEVEVKKLVKAHIGLDEPATGVIWIKRDATEAWLVEIIPSMQDDEKAYEPIHFGPGITFRYPVVVIAGNAKSLRAAVTRKPSLAKLIAGGKAMHGTSAKFLMNHARRIAEGA